MCASLDGLTELERLSNPGISNRALEFLPTREASPHFSSYRESESVHVPPAPLFIPYVISLFI